MARSPVVAAAAALALALALLAAGAAADPLTNTPADDDAQPEVAAAFGAVSGLHPAAGFEVVLDTISGATPTASLNTWTLTGDANAGRSPFQRLTTGAPAKLHYVEAFMWRGPSSPFSALSAIRVNFFAAATPCNRGAKVGDEFSVQYAANDARISYTVSGTDANYRLYKIDISGENFVLPAGAHALMVSFVFCSGCGSFYTVTGNAPQGAPGAGTLSYADVFGAAPCAAQSTTAFYRVLADLSCAPGVVEFVCAADFAPAFTWCVDGAAYAMQCAPGSGCAAGRYQANPCTLRVDLQHAGVTPPACNGADGYVCDAARPAEYYRCAGAQGGAHEGWMPCAPGTTCKATPAGAVTPFNPCW